MDIRALLDERERLMAMDEPDYERLAEVDEVLIGEIPRLLDLIDN